MDLDARAAHARSLEALPRVRSAGCRQRCVAALPAVQPPDRCRAGQQRRAGVTGARASGLRQRKGEDLMTPHEVAEALRDDVAEGGWHYDTMLLAANMLDAVEAALVIP